MASGPITSWQIEGETMETVTDFIFLGSKITADGYYSPEIKHLLLGRKVMTNLDSIFKSRDITFFDKDQSSQGYGFSSVHVWMWELDHKESWALKNAFEPWCWKWILRVPWTARRSNQAIVKAIIPEYSLERLMLKLKCQYFGYLCEEVTDWKRSWCWERLKVGGEGADRGWDGWMASPTQWSQTHFESNSKWVWVNSRRW